MHVDKKILEMLLTKENMILITNCSNLDFFFAKVFREKTLKPYTQVYDLNVLCVMLPNEQIKL